MSEKDQIRKVLNRQFATKQDRVEARPGQMGDGYGAVEVTGREHYVYVRVAGMIEEIFNNRVPPENDLLVTVGFDPAQPNLYQVLSTRTATPGGTTGGAVAGYAPAVRYQWMATGGGQDPLFVEKRQFLPRRIGPYSGLFIQVYRDIIWTGTTWASINTQTVNMTTHVPSTTGKAAFVLITIDDAGAVIATKGSEVDIADLALSDLPAVPAGTREVLGAVRVYYGQTAVQEARSNTDIVDLRFSGWAAAAATGDMEKATYDTDNDGVVDNAEALESHPASYFAIADHSHYNDHPITFEGAGADLAGLIKIGLNEASNPVIAVGAGSDSKIREPGNVLYEPDDATRPYKFFYTGYSGTYGTNEKIHYAYSTDGITWTKYASNPVISARRAEDPYVVKIGSVYYLYAEDKEAGGVENTIRRWHSSDCETWTDDGNITISDDCASPIVLYKNGAWYLLYEKYRTAASYTPDIRLATSTDGLTWTVSADNPVFSVSDISWALQSGSSAAIVPDDIIRLDGVYYMIYHAVNSGATGYQCGIAQSTNLTDWTNLSAAAITSLDTASMFSSIQFIYDGRVSLLYYVEPDTSGIFRGYPLTSTSGSWGTIKSGVLTITGDYARVSSESSTSDDLVTISGGTARQALVLQAATGHTITVKHNTGNIVLSAAADLALTGLQTLLLFYDGTKWRDTYKVPASADEKAKVSSNDTTPGYLNGKLVAGTGITLTENSDGGNETLTITGPAVGQYSQFLTVVSGGDFSFVIDGDGNPVMGLFDLE